MKMKESKDPWTEGQKQITFPIPGWLVFLVKAPFRLLFGLLATTGALDSAGNQQTQITGSGRAINDSNQEFEFNFNGTLNNDDNPLSGK